MIFKNLFAPKWKSNKVADRLQAVAQLDADKAKNKDVLITLATQDDTVDVRKSALTKLNDISLWWKAYKEEQNNQLQETAEKKVFNAILAKEQSLKNEQVTQFITQCKKPSQLEQLLPFCDTPDQTIAVLKRIAKPSLIVAHFSQGDEALQQALLPLIKQHNQVAQIMQSAKGSVKQALEQEAEQAKLAKVRPAQVQQEVKMILAQMNALKEKFDFKHVDAKQSMYLSQWDKIELTWLDDETRAEVEAKFDALKSKVSAHHSTLKAEFEKAEQAQKAALAHNTLIEELVQIKATLETKLENALKEPTDALLSELDSAKAQFLAKLDSLTVIDKAASELQAKAKQLSAQIEELPHLQQTLKSVSEVLSQFEQVTKVTSKEVLDQAQEELFTWQNKAKQEIDQLPKAIAKQYHAQQKALSAAWHEEAKSIKDELNTHFKHCQRKLKDTKRLIESGRYKVCFGIFKGIEDAYENLTEGLKDKLQGEYDSIKKQLDDVNDWQREISLPKRKEMLEEVVTLIADTEMEITVRADAIKVLRKRWNELGYLQTDEEKALDKQFNEQLEQAFAPCRAFYAEREKAREANMAVRKQIIADVTAIAAELSTDTLQSIEKRHNKVKKQWREAGEVDGKNYKNLLSELKREERPIVDFIKQSQKQHAQEKEIIAKRAAELIDSDDITAACDELKKLQSDWKKIGFAGHKVESKIWKAFRESNDAVFAKRDQQKAQNDAENEKRFEQFNAQLTQVIEAHQNINTPSQAQAAVDAYHGFAKELETQGMDHKGLLKALNGQLEKAQKQQQQLIETAHSQAYQSLFDSFARGDALPANWQLNNTPTLSRQQLTVRLEIVADVDSPESDKTQRMNEQVELLQAKVQGDLLTKEALLKQWLNVAPLADSEHALFERVKNIFC